MPFLIPIAGALITAGLAGTAIGTIGASIIGGLISFGLSSYAKSQNKPAQDKFSSIQSMQLGEGPRQVVVGSQMTGGRLIYAFNDDTGNTDPDSPNEWETMIILLGDTRQATISGFQNGEDRFVFLGDGAQGGSFVEGDGDVCLYIWHRDGSPGQTPPATVVSASDGRWTNDDTLTGCTYVVVRYRVSDEVWNNKRPEFKWYGGGAYCYDPRLDSTVSGGSGSCRWGVPSTYVETDNPIIHALNYRLGFWNGTELMVGRGLSMKQALGEGDDPHIARLMAAANVCDEIVPWKTDDPSIDDRYKRRYQSRLLIQSTDAYDDVMQKFADATGGILVTRQGRLEIVPGVAQTPHDAFVDNDLVVGEPIELLPFLSVTERVNTVTHQYLDIWNYWNLTSAPMRRDDADIVKDGKPYERIIEFGAVAEQHCAQRIAEIRRREARLERTATVTLPARFSNVECGDWLPWQSDRYFGGDEVMFCVMRIETSVGLTHRVTLREISAEVYAWDPETDEIEVSPGLPGFVLQEDGGFELAEDGTKVLQEA